MLREFRPGHSFFPTCQDVRRTTRLWQYGHEVVGGSGKAEGVAAGECANHRQAALADVTQKSYNTL